MSFNMADLLTTKASKRSPTTTSDSEMELNTKRRKLDDEAVVPTEIERKPVGADTRYNNNNNEDSHESIGEFYNQEQDLSPKQTETPAGVESAKKKPYGGRPLKFQCQHCDRRFHAPSHLKRHVMSHSSERPFRCEVCDKGFLQAWHLGRHMTTHTGNKPFHCPECPRSFGSRFEMKTHVNYIHRGIKEHQCNVCGKHFTLRSNLKVHMRKHTGEKPYKCSFCSKRFGQRGHLQYHIRKHAGTVERSHVTEPIDADASTSETDRTDYPSQCYGNKDAVSPAAESDKDSGVDSCEYQSTASSCSSPSVKDFDEQGSPLFDKEAHSRVHGYLYNCHAAPYPEYTREPSPVSYLKQFVCDMCNSGFESMSSLKAHVRHSHPRKGISVGRYKCAICLEGFTSIDALQVHAYAGHQTPFPARRTSIFFPPGSKAKDAEQSRSVANGHSERSLAFSVERLCQSNDSSSPASPMPSQQCSCCDSERRKSSLVVHPHFVPVITHGNSSRVMRSYHSFLQMQDSLRPFSY